jgi:DNA-binding PadR family transcriptional regulator
MSATRLLVLGAVRDHGRTHGYQVRRDLEYWGADEWANVKPGSLYHALKQLAKQGMLRAHEVAASASGPPRTDYEMTPAGEEEFLRLLRFGLTRLDQRPDMLAAAVGFISELTRAEALALLKERVAELEAWREEVTPHLEEAGQSPGGHIGEVLGLWVHSAQSGAAWTRGLIARLERGDYEFSGEPGKHPRAGFSPPGD